MHAQQICRHYLSIEEIKVLVVLGNYQYLLAVEN